MADQQHTRPLLLGLVASAVVPVALVATYMLIGSIMTSGDIFIFVIVTLFGLFVSLPCALLFGAPYVFLLRRLGWLHGVTVCLGACVAGAIGLWIMNYQLNYFPAAGERAHEMAISGASGSPVNGAILGLVAGLSMSFASGIRWRISRPPSNTSLKRTRER